MREKIKLALFWPCSRFPFLLLLLFARSPGNFFLLISVCACLKADEMMIMMVVCGLLLARVKFNSLMNNFLLLHFNNRERNVEMGSLL